MQLPDKPILLPPFVDSAHRLSYHLTRKGRNVTDRVVCVLGFACPDITYSPAIYPIAALLLHFMSVCGDYLTEKSWIPVENVVQKAQTCLRVQLSTRQVVATATTPAYCPETLINGFAILLTHFPKRPQDINLLRLFLFTRNSLYYLRGGADKNTDYVLSTK
ncbi:hypothetical protein J6590_038908 [Homalodisca vitripennis]|nr:hypothetical protein J6590_038908 [Homalodisca vitripennis]